MNAMNEELGFIDSGNEIKIIVKYLKQDTRLMYNTYNEEGQLILKAHLAFTQEKINELLSSGIEAIYYSKPKYDTDFKYSNSLEEYLKNEAYEGPRTIQVETQELAVSTMKKIVEQISNKEDIDFLETRDVIELILHDIDNTEEDVINLLAIQVYDDDAYVHSLNAGIISMVLAKKMNLNEDLIKDIGLGGFLHDIGKIKCPYELISKSDPLTHDEMQLVRKHPIFGYELVKENSQISKSVKDMILLHHEKFDGSGYPLGLKGDQISVGAYIVSLAESYDDLTTDHPYQSAVTQSETFKRILKDSGKHFKSDIAHLFTQNMKNFLKENYYYSVGDYVILNSNEIARVISKENEITLRPGVEILVNHQGKILSKSISVDLNRDGTRYIVRALDPAVGNTFTNI